MESMLLRLVATWIKSQELAPRRAPSAAVRCESLEGRQLLSTTGLLRGQMGMPSSPTAQRVQFSTKGTMGGQNARGFGGGSAASTTFTHVGQVGSLKGQGSMMGGGAGRGGLSARNGVPALPNWQSAPDTSTTTLEAPVTTSAVGDASQTAVPTATPATDTTTTQADPANGAVATTQLDGGAPAMRGGSFTAMPSGPMGGWFGGQAGNREPVSFSMAPGQQTDGANVQFGNVSSTSAPSDALKQDFEKLHTDLQAIQDKSEVTPKLQAAVRNDFEAIQKAATTAPDQDALNTLAATVKSLDGQIPTDAQRAQLVADFTAVVKSQGITDQTLIDTAVSDIQAVVAASHVTADDLATIAADREAITTEENADTGAAIPATPSTGDAVGSLFTGLTGGLESGAPRDVPFAGGVKGSQVSAFPGDFTSAGGVLMGGGGQFNGSPINVSPGAGGMKGPINFSHGSVMMDGGGQFGPHSVSSTSGVGASGQFHGSPAVVSHVGGGAGGQSAQFTVSPNGGGMGGKFGGRLGG